MKKIYIWRKNNKILLIASPKGYMLEKWKNDLMTKFVKISFMNLKLQLEDTKMPFWKNILDTKTHGGKKKLKIT